MKKVTLNTGFGIVWKDGKIDRRFDLPIGTHQMSDSDTVVEYETFDEVLKLDWPPSLSVSADKKQVVNDAKDTVTISVDVLSEYDDTWEGEVVVDGHSFTETFSNQNTTTREITTTKSAGTMITVEARNDGLLQKDSIEIEVVGQ